MAKKCAACKDELPLDFMQCASIAGCQLHFGACAGIQEGSWRKANKSQWRRTNCRKEQKPLAQTQPSEPVSPEEMRNFMMSVNDNLNEVKKISAMNDLMKELKKTVDFMSDKYDEVINKLGVMETERKEQATAINELKSQVKEKNQIINQLQNRMRDTEQYARNRNIEISGVEDTREENLRAIMANIAVKIGVPFQDKDIDVIHRLPVRRGEGPPKIVAQFTSRTVRNHWLKKKNGGDICEARRLFRMVQLMQGSISSHT